MAKCNTCGREMMTAYGCVKVPVTHHRKKYNPIKVGDPNDFYFGAGGGRCGDCGAKPGHYHHPGCDCERCPICGGQLISCGCDDAGRNYGINSTSIPEGNTDEAVVRKVIRDNAMFIYFQEEYGNKADSPWFRFLRVSTGEDGKYAIYQVVNVTKTTCELQAIFLHRGGKFNVYPILDGEEYDHVAPGWDYYCRTSRKRIERLLKEQDESGFNWKSLYDATA